MKGEYNWFEYDRMISMGIAPKQVEPEKHTSHCGCECGWWEDYQVVCFFRNERDEILGMMVCFDDDTWCGWDYTLLSSDSRPTKLGEGRYGEVRKMVEGVMKI